MRPIVLSLALNGPKIMNPILNSVAVLDDRSLVYIMIDYHDSPNHAVSLIKANILTVCSVGY